MTDDRTTRYAEAMWRAEKSAQPHSTAYADTYDREPGEYQRIVQETARAATALADAERADLADYATALEEYADHLEAILRDHARPSVAEGMARLPKRPERP